MANFLKILSLPAAVEFIRMLIFIMLSRMLLKTTALDFFAVFITILLFIWIGWRSQRFGGKGVVTVLTTSIIFAVYLLLLAVGIYFLGLSNEINVQQVNTSAAITGLAVSHGMFLPIGLLIAMLGWYIAKRKSS